MQSHDSMELRAVMVDPRQQPGRKPPNLRTALVLLSIAAVFFAGVILKRVFYG
jgi:hypothetical protein